MNFDMSILIGAAIIPVAVFVGVFLFKRLAVTTPEGHEVLQLRFGKLEQRWTEPGLVGAMKRIIPWHNWITVSRQWDERIYRAIETNDNQGTIVQVDLRVTFKIADSNKALFAVDDWEGALESTALHEAAAQLAGRDRALFLRSSPELSALLTKAVSEDMVSYGIVIHDVRIANVEFRPEVTRQMFEAVAAKLEVAKAENEERGRTDAALLLARTEQRVADLEARAKTESLKAVGRAYEVLRKRPEVFEAYTRLYRLSQLDPSRVVSFDGFVDGELSRGSLVESDLERYDPDSPGRDSSGRDSPGRGDANSTPSGIGSRRPVPNGAPL
jgi:regulator of protease activity HflC (stomatin/prohibitin superfamily)